MDVTIIISSAVVSAVISLVGVIVSSLVAKSSATKTAKITTEAEIQKLKIELAHTEKMRHEDQMREDGRKVDSVYREMLAAVTNFCNKPDVNTKTAAVDAVSALALVSNKSKPAIKKLLEFVQTADSFEGPSSAEFDALLSKVIEDR